jgi:hypothetical protein
VLGVKESVYVANCNVSARYAFESKKLRSCLEVKKTQGVYVCGESVLYCIGVCCRREKRESNNQSTHTNTLSHSWQISFEKLSRVLGNTANHACIILSADSVKDPESPKTA